MRNIKILIMSIVLAIYTILILINLGAFESKTKTIYEHSSRLPSEVSGNVVSSKVLVGDIFENPLQVEEYPINVEIKSENLLSIESYTDRLKPTFKNNFKLIGKIIPDLENGKIRNMHNGGVVKFSNPYTKSNISYQDILVIFPDTDFNDVKTYKITIKLDEYDSPL